MTMAGLSRIPHDDVVNIALIETRADIGSTFRMIAGDCGISPHTFVASYADIPSLAREIESSVDAILCRPGTADHAAEAVGVPVITIPITSFDLVCALDTLETRFRHGAVFCHQKIFAGIEVIEKLFNCKISQYAYIDTDEIPDKINDAMLNNVEYCFGGSITQKYADHYGMKGVQISPNEDSIFRSIHEALHAVKVRRQERRMAARLKMAFDSTSEGIVVTDSEDKVTIYNSAAEKICKTEEYAAIGRNIVDVVRDTGIATQFRPEEPNSSYLKSINGKTFAFQKKPVLLDNDQVGTVFMFEDITKIQQLESQIRRQIHNKGLLPRYQFEDILCRSAPMQECKDLAKRYASTQASVVIEGESGTGKELFAQSIHNASSRATGPFVAVNCAAIPDTLLESELFGYEGGAFTGARKDGKAGLFEQAHLGTIFLDEIGEIPESLQARLLRVLQEREVRRVGGDRVIAVDIRIISATNKNLLKKVQDGTFRDDLFYRLNVLSLKIPPLRERREDIPLISASILEKLGVQVTPQIISEIQPVLSAYDWPGNIRELSNILERLSLLVIDARSPSDWHDMLLQVLHVSPPSKSSMLHLTLDATRGLKEIVRQVERQVLDQMLAEHDHNFAEVAAVLKVGRTSVWRKTRP